MLDVTVLEKDLMKNLGIEKFTELEFVKEKKREIDVNLEKSITFVSYLNFVAKASFGSNYDELNEDERQRVLIIAQPTLNNIENGKLTLEDLKIDSITSSD